MEDLILILLSPPTTPKPGDQDDTIESGPLDQILKRVTADNAPIDGIGLQDHFIVGALPGGVGRNIEAFTALGVEVAITELDIRMTLPATPALLAQQQKDYQTAITACKNVKGCVGITIWDHTDKYSWVPQTFSGQGAACPWDQVSTNTVDCR